LSSYLAGLAVLRLISEQNDPNASGWWDSGIFQLESKLDREGLINFFLDEYVPSPIVSPWNGGSGFLEGDNTEGIDAIQNCESKRFAIYRETIRMVKSFPEMPPTGLPLGTMLNMLEEVASGKAGKSWNEIIDLVNEVRSKVDLVAPIFAPESPLNLTIEELEAETKPPRRASQAEKDRVKSIKVLIKPSKKIRTKVKQMKRGAGKEQIIQACRDRLDERVVEWIDATAVIGPEGEIEHPPILGTGGNEGRFEYSNAFMKNLSWMLLSDDEESSRSLLKGALFGDSTDHLLIASVGQYDPGRAGGFNQGQGIENKDFPVNPWNFVLTVEGTITWASSVARRQRASSRGFMRSPFTVRATPVGYTSSFDRDDQNARAEIWAPIWTHPSGYSEIRTFISEGRADVERKSASNGIEFAEAASSLGVDRGVSEFVRYSLLKRRGDSYVALPAGRFSVRVRTESDLIRELDLPLRRVDGFLRGFKGQGPPARFLSARRSIDEAIYSLLQHGGAAYVKHLVAAIGKLERLIAQRGGGGSPKLSGPISGLSPRWIVAADDGSTEVRIAAALASIRSTGDVGPIRSNLAPVDPRKPWMWADGRGQTAWEGNSLSARMASVLSRRLMDAQRFDIRPNPLWGEIRVSLGDASALIDGIIDESLVEDLLFGFTWIDWSHQDRVQAARRDLRERKRRWKPTEENPVPRSWALLKLLFYSGKMKVGGEEKTIKPEPSIVPLLNAGRVNDACKVAGRRLTSVGLFPLTSDFPYRDDGVRLAAALLLPIYGKQRIMELVLRPTEKKL
jgi:CRISPR-associated protein Csx17